MRNLLALIGLVVVVFVGVGWYQGWYTFALQPGANGKQRVQLDVDTARIADDAKRFGETVGKTVEAVRERAEHRPPPSPAEFVGPPVPADLPVRSTPAVPARTPGQFAVPAAPR